MKKRTYIIRKNYRGAFDRYLVCDQNGRPLYSILDLANLRDEKRHLENAGHIVIDEKNQLPNLEDLDGKTNQEKIENCLQRYAHEMRPPKKFGYARVSTASQAIKGNSLEAQVEVLRNAGAEDIYKDVYTGAAKNRPELDKLDSNLKKGDTIIITKLDRLSRSVSDGSELIQDWSQRGVKIKILNMGDHPIDDSPIGNLMLHIILAFAEFERDMIVERTQEGRITSGKLGGRPRKYKKSKTDHAMELLKYHSYNEVANMTGISKSTLQRMKKIYGYNHNEN